MPRLRRWMRVVSHDRPNGNHCSRASTSQPAIPENAFPEVAGEASLAQSVLVSDFAFRRKRRQAAALPDGAGLTLLGRSVRRLLRGRGGDLVCRCPGAATLRFGRIGWGGGSRDWGGRSSPTFPGLASVRRELACAGLRGARLFCRRGRLLLRKPSPRSRLAPGVFLRFLCVGPFRRRFC